jgi:hypothetical protein
MMMILLRIRFEGTLWTNYGLIFGPAGFKRGSGRSAILLAITVTFFAVGDHGHFFRDHGHFFSRFAITVTFLVRSLPCRW